MSPIQICKQYLAAADKADLNGVLSLFTPEALVISPLYGSLDVQTYHQRLFLHTKHSIIRLLHVFEEANDPTSAALHFHYTWILQSGEKVELEIMAVFELTSDKSRLAKLTYIYDTGPIRPYLGRIRL